MKTLVLLLSLFSLSAFATPASEFNKHVRFNPESSFVTFNAFAVSDLNTNYFKKKVLDVDTPVLVRSSNRYLIAYVPVGNTIDAFIVNETEFSLLNKVDARVVSLMESLSTDTGLSLTLAQYQMPSSTQAFSLVKTTKETTFMEGLGLLVLIFIGFAAMGAAGGSDF